ncbi:MAG: WXG100 family type VII secretion target [Clostridia bacterium]|nr:WXG100 family type VII secretion target [Clostridia bacterium]MBR6184630.1 WXG100 family type VII secretion target [Clostridia bacterium]
MAALSTIMRHEAQLRQVAAQIREANSIIADAKAGAEAAATELAGNWEGEARDAFVQEQLNAKTWIEKMIEIIAEMVNTINNINTSYTNVDQTVADMIRSK